MFHKGEELITKLSDKITQFLGEKENLKNSLRIEINIIDSDRGELR